MSLIPRTPIPEGAIRYNTDSNKMEVWIGDKWMIVATSSPNLDGGVRGVFFGGAPSGQDYTKMNFITISTQGDAQDFGDMSSTRAFSQSCSNATRALSFAGGSAPSGVSDVIDFITMASLGNATDFGDISQDLSYMLGAMASPTRAVAGGGYTPSGNTNVIEYVQIATTGDAVDFGDLQDAKAEASGCSNGHGGL